MPARSGVGADPAAKEGRGRFAGRLASFRYEWAVYAVLVVGFVARLVALGEYPAGFNQDEASAAYDAYSILKTGYDRNGQFLPVHLIAWGSGQNALYSYLSMPFLAVFGLDVWAFRLPMALIGCLSLFAFWRLLLAMTDRKTALAGLALLAICPWHILKSRWALESNLFPDLLLFGVLFLVIGLQHDRLPPFLAGCGVLGLSSYAYGTAYLFLPVFVLPLLLFLVAKKRLSFRRACAGLGVLAVVALPMMLFVLVNTFGLQAIRLPFMTIPRLPANRMTAMASVFSPEFLRDSIGNFAEASKIAVVQTDGLIWNAMDGFGSYTGFPCRHRHWVSPLRDRGTGGTARLGIRPERLVSGGTGAGICSQTEYQPHQRPVDSLDLLYRLGRGMGRAEPPAFPYGGGRAVCLGVPALFGAVSHRISGENGGGV